MSEFSLWDFFFGSKHEPRSNDDFWERQERIEENHRVYLERQRRREERHQAYLERQARREANRKAYFERITNNVKRFRAQYEGTLENIKKQGLDVFIIDDYNAVNQQIKKLDSLIALDEIEAARDLSLEIGQKIHTLIPLANTIRRNEERKKEEIQQQARKDFIDQLRRNLESEKDSNPEAIQKTVKKLENLKENIQSLSESELQDQLVAETDRVDGEIVDETIRREVVKAIYQSLKRTGFIVTNPQLSGDVVLIHAQKPAGQQADFTVKLDGELSYKFDNYEGQKCRKDIEDVTSLLDECYGIKLSKRKVLWSNPDRIQKGSKDNPAGGEASSMKK